MIEQCRHVPLRSSLGIPTPPRAPISVTAPGQRLCIPQVASTNIGERPRRPGEFAPFDQKFLKSGDLNGASANAATMRGAVAVLKQPRRLVVLDDGMP